MPRPRRLSRRLALGVGLAILLFVGLAVLPARAVEFRTGNVVIGPGEVIDDDLFISGSRVVMDGTVNGDLWIAASEVEVGGTVNGSLFFAGQELRVGGTIDGSTYSAGSLVALMDGASVTRNLYFAGYALRVEPGAVVNRDALAAGNQALVAGRVGRNVGFAGRALEILGTIGGDVQAEVAAPGSGSTPPPFMPVGGVAPAPPGIRVAPEASIGGRLTYRSPVDQAQDIRSQPAGGVVYEPQAPREAPREPAGVRWVFAWLRLYGSLLALSALALYGLGAPLRRLAEEAAVVPLLSVGWGILIILAGFAAAFVAGVLILIVSGLLAAGTFGGLAATVFFGAGTAWAFGFTVFLLAVIWGSRIVVAYLLGWLVLERVARLPRVLPLYIIFAGTGIYSLAQAIPFFGDIASAVATVLGFGAIYLVWRDSQARA